MSQSIAVNNAAFVGGLSPYNWYRNGSTYVETPNPGAYFKLNFTGTSFGITVDVSRLTGASVTASLYPVIAYTVDGVRSTRQLLSSDTTVTLASSLADTTHSVEVALIGVDESGVVDRWTTPVMALIITALVIDNAKTVSQASLLNAGWMLAYGDSITEGAVVLAAAGVYAQVEDATKGYQKYVADYLNMEYGNVAFASQQWSATGVSNIPGLTTSYNLIFNGQSRTFSPAPNIVTCNMGYNGTVTSATIKTWMENIRSACGSGSWIVMIVPFAQVNAGFIITAYNDYVAAHPTDTRVSLINLGSTGSSLVTANSYDGVHPNATGQYLLAQLLNPLMPIPLKAGNPSSSAAGTV
jgi:lysophospholipase L1-like esterase